VDSYDARVLIGETYLPIADLMAYYGENLGGVHLPMNFHLMLRPWDAETVASLVQEYEGGRALTPPIFANTPLPSRGTQSAGTR
ncbi:MAG: alpha-amylase family glycosyl hydrolase, partial [Rhodospirillales bacterium]